MDPSYNNSFGSPAISPVSGDIVLQSSPKKRGKTWMFLSSLLIVIVIIVGVVSVILLRNSDRNYNYNELFNIYVNSLIYGKESSDDVDLTINMGSQKYVSSHYGDSAYLEKLIEEYDGFFDSLKSGDEVLANRVEEFSPIEILSFLRDFDKDIIFNSDDLWTVYQSNNSAEETKDYIYSLYNYICTGTEEDTQCAIDGEDSIELSFKEYAMEYSIALVDYWSGAIDETPNQGFDYYVMQRISALCDELESRASMVEALLENGDVDAQE